MQLERTSSFVGKNGDIFKIDSHGRRNQFVFGKPLADGVERSGTFTHSGLAAISARNVSGNDLIAKKYNELVERFVKNISAHVRAGDVKLNGARAFIEELKREAKDANEQPHPGFLWDLKTNKNATLFPIFIFDVASALGVPVGAVVENYDVGLFIFGKGVKIDGTHVKVGDEQASNNDSHSPIYDKAELQSELYATAAREMAEAREHGAALELYRKAIWRCPENADAHCGAATEFLWLRRYPEALSESEIAISLQPGLDRAYHLSGLALSYLDRDDEAADKYRSAIRYAATNADKSSYHYNLAVSLYNERELYEAKNSCDISISLEKNNANAYKLRGRINHELGMVKQADEDFRRYNELTRGKRLY